MWGGLTMTHNYNDVAAARWAIAYHSDSKNARAKKWYRVSRMVYADGGWFELYWHPDVATRGNNVLELRRLAIGMGLEIWPGVFRDKPMARRGNEMEHVL
jgi:hypothetical protein